MYSFEVFIDKYELTMLLPSDIEITLYPQRVSGGMQTGRMPAGIQIRHLPTNTVVTCELFRTQLENRNHALNELSLKIEGLKENTK